MGATHGVRKSGIGVGGRAIRIDLRTIRTDEESEHAWVLDFAAPVGALEALLLRYRV